jgi:hypothetical protein
MDTRDETGYAACCTTKGTSGEKTVTETEWMACNEPDKMLALLRGKASDRKLRLFACSCVRRSWQLLTDSGRQAIATAEAYADGMTDTETLKAASCAAHKPVDEEIEAANISGHGVSLNSPLSAADAAFEASNSMDSDITRHLVPLHAARAAQVALGGVGGECAAQAVLLRDLLGNPFRPITISLAILAWNDGLVVRLAQAAYEERHLPEGTLDTGRLAVLADALEEAGLMDADILGHLRSSEPHMRGCWAVDLCMGKS